MKTTKLKFIGVVLLAGVFLAAVFIQFIGPGLAAID
jgi:hypothetical protein